jgi:hypothetical protein
MQYKMLNEVLEVQRALLPKSVCTMNAFQSLRELLQEMEKHGELTAKQKRVLNCLNTVADGEAQRLERSKRIKSIGFLNGYSSNPNDIG